MIIAGTSDPAVFCNLGILCKNSGRINEALEHYEQALEFEPEDPQIYSNIGNLYRDTGNLDQALKGIGTPRLARGDKLHHKFAVVDNKTVITGSFNWSPSAAHTNDETLLVIHSPQLAKHFTREMDRLWDGTELGITPHIQRKLDRQKIRCGDGKERD